MIELTQLQKTIDQHLVLDIASLHIGPGTIAAVIGPVGSGKKVLLDLLLGRLTPTVGNVRLGGIDPAADPTAFSRQVGVLFSEDGVYPHQSAKANLVFHCRLRDIPRSRADEVLADVGLADHAQVRADRLSSGLLRRLAFGRAILHDPAILVLVNPFAKCDEASIQLLRRLFRVQADSGKTVLILADDIAHLYVLCDVLYTLERGQLVEASEPDENGQPSLPFKIPVRLEDKVALVNPSDIMYAVAQDGRASLRTAQDLTPTQFTLSELEDRLSRSGFFRAHRGYLVNLQRVKEVIPYTRNSFTLVLDDDETEIPLSKAAARELRELLGY
jgi:ABC-2 type transport system ATP-binding protein